MLRSVLIALALLASPAAALDERSLRMEIIELNNADPQRVVAAATASCLAFPRDRAAVAVVFDLWSWERDGEGQWIEINRGDVWVTLLGNNTGFACDIASGLSQADALIAVTEMLTRIGWQGWSSQKDDQGCAEIHHPDGISIFVTSAGQDPVCTETGDSAVRIAWATDGPITSEKNSK